MKKTFFLSLLTILSIAISWSQNCVPIGLEIEFFDVNGESKELYNYNFSYYPEGGLKEVKILEKDEATHTLKFEKVASGAKIIWYWDGEYDSHYVVTPTSIYEFGDDENDVDIKNADDAYSITIENNKLTKAHYSSSTEQTLSYENDLLVKAIGHKKNTDKTNKKWMEEYTYTDSTNPLYYLQELGYLYIFSKNFINLNITLFKKIPSKNKYTFYENGEEKVGLTNYNYKLKENNCPEEFESQDKYGKTVYRFTY